MMSPLFGHCPNSNCTVNHGRNQSFVPPFLDGIASPSTYPCQWVSQSVIDSLRLEIAIASPSFASLLCLDLCWVAFNCIVVEIQSQSERLKVVFRGPVMALSNVKSSCQKNKNTNTCQVFLINLPECVPPCYDQRGGRSRWRRGWCRWRGWCTRRPGSANAKIK